MNKKIPQYLQILLIIFFIGGILFLGFSGYLNSTIKVVLNPFINAQKWLSDRYIAVYELITLPEDISSLRQQNAELESEVASLETQVIQLQQQLKEAEVLYALLDFARAQPADIYVAAAIIGVDPSPFLHYVIIDHGSDDGLRHGMPVISEKGLVGRVDAVTANAARVQLITDPSSVVNVTIQPSETDSTLVGSTTGDIAIEMISQEVEIQKGDLILTSGLGGNYPSDIVVGQVINIRKRETDLFQTASVQPAVDFSSLRAVLIITNFKPVDTAPLIPTTETNQ